MRSTGISVWLALGSRFNDNLTERDVRSSENLMVDSAGTTMSLVPWSKANGGNLSE